MEEEIVVIEDNGVEEITIEEENYSGKPYELPIASETTLGGIKVGKNLTIDKDGTLNATGEITGDIDLTDYAKKTDLPTKTSQLTNDSNFINEIKTVNGQSLKGTGNIVIEGGSGDSSNLKYNYLVNGKRLYVDGVNGSDDNDGSSTSPFKTIERFFDEANNLNDGRNDIRCYVVSAGVYTISKHSINHLTIHITGQVDGVILKFTTDRDVKFYECHTNLNNVTIQAPTATELAFDGGSVALTKCTFEKAVTCYSCSGYFETITMPNLIAYYSNLSLHVINITNTSPTSHAYRFESCVVRMYGSCQNVALSSTPSGTVAFVCAFNSFIYYAITLRIQSPTYNYGFYGDGNFVATTSLYYNYWTDRTSLGVAFKDVPSMFLDTSKNIKISELSSGGTSGGITEESDPTVPSWVKAITEKDIANWNSGGGGSGTSNVVVSPTEPSIGGDVWFQRTVNLFDKSMAVKNARIISNGEYRTDYSGSCSSPEYIKVEPNLQYTISGVNDTVNTTGFWYHFFYDANKNPISGIIPQQGTHTITTPENAHYMRVTFSYTDLNTFQIERGAVASPYSNYVKDKIHIRNNGYEYKEFFKGKEYDLTQYINPDLTGVVFTRTRCINKFDRVIVDFVLSGIEIPANTNFVLFTLPEELKPLQSADFTPAGNNEDTKFTGIGWLNKNNNGIFVNLTSDLTATGYIRCCIVYDL